MRYMMAIILALLAALGYLLYLKKGRLQREQKANELKKEREIKMSKQLKRTSNAYTKALGTFRSLKQSGSFEIGSRSSVLGDFSPKEESPLY
jgi:hypothetical protein